MIMRDGKYEIMIFILISLYAKNEVQPLFFISEIFISLYAKNEVQPQLFISDLHFTIQLKLISEITLIFTILL